MFASPVIGLLESEEVRQRMTQAAWRRVCSSFPWKLVSRPFEELLEGSGR